eukprot:2950100-Karenia_brevis.AAC.1
MIDDSEIATWVVLINIPRKEVKSVNPMRMLEHFQGGRLCDSSRNMNLGPKHVGRRRGMHNLDGILTDESLTKEKWRLIRAIVHLMPNSMADDLYNVADTKSMKAAYYT